MAGIAFAPDDGPYPAAYDEALFFAVDYRATASGR